MSENTEQEFVFQRDQVRVHDYGLRYRDVDMPVLGEVASDMLGFQLVDFENDDGSYETGFGAINTRFGGKSLLKATKGEGEHKTRAPNYLFLPILDVTAGGAELIKTNGQGRVVNAKRAAVGTFKGGVSLQLSDEFDLGGLPAPYRAALEAEITAEVTVVQKLEEQFHANLNVDDRGNHQVGYGNPGTVYN